MPAHEETLIAVREMEKPDPPRDRTLDEPRLPRRVIESEPKPSADDLGIRDRGSGIGSRVPDP